MRPTEDVHQVFRLAADGFNQSAIARRVGISRATVRDWLRHGEVAVLNRPMGIAATQRNEAPGRCPAGCEFVRELDGMAYAYLLGQYLGDGCISRIESNFRLRIACCNAYPQIMAECASAIDSVRPGGRVGFIAKQGCTEVYATWRHWPCLLPDGEGPKHRRPIVLEPWQQAIALDRRADRFIRGLGAERIGPLAQPTHRDLGRERTPRSSAPRKHSIRGSRRPAGEFEQT